MLNQLNEISNVPPISGYSLLVIDDEVANIKLLGTLSKSFQIRFAKNANEALDMLQRSPLPDLILTDIVMPTLDGFELCKRIKQDINTQLIPVIFLSSLDSVDDKSKGFQSGCVDYITKPFEINEVVLRIENHIRLNQQLKLLESIAFLDPLTRIANRRKYDDCLAAEWNRCIRHNEPLSMLVFDIDHFKQYNDIYGHEAGDKCLMLVAQSLNKLAGRSGDLFARIGGEEFVLILPECAQAGALKKANDALIIIEELTIQHAGGLEGKHLTVSIGVGSCIPNRNIDRIELFKACDKALYKQKHSGRNGFTATEMAIEVPSLAHTAD